MKILSYFIDLEGMTGGVLLFFSQRQEWRALIAS